MGPVGSSWVQAPGTTLHMRLLPQFSAQQPGSPTVLRTLHTLPWQDPHPGTPTWHPARQPPSSATFGPSPTFPTHL